MTKSKSKQTIKLLPTILNGETPISRRLRCVVPAYFDSIYGTFIPTFQSSLWADQIGAEGWVDMEVVLANNGLMLLRSRSALIPSAYELLT